MTHLPYEDRREAENFVDIITADEARPSIGRQMLNGVGGLVVLLITGLVIVLLVLWKSP